MKKLVVINVVLSLLLVSVRAQNDVCQVDAGKIYHITVRDNTYTFDRAEYAVFIPENVQTIQGVFVHQHGCTMEGHGASTAYDVQYQSFAKKWGLAVVAPDLYPRQGNCSEWMLTESGSGKALLKALEIVGNTSGHAELKDAPLLLWGHSGGGGWTLGMMRDYPERIIAVFAYSPASGGVSEYPAEASKIPLMIRHAGKDDIKVCWMNSLDTFSKLRKMNGHVSIAYNDGQNHNFSYVRYMAIPFYESVMAQRLPVEASGNKLRDLQPDLVWLGDTVNCNIYPASSFSGDPSSMCHFPDSLTAFKWREYVITGTVIDHTPPSAPFDLKVNIIRGNQAELTWKADADIESGIHHFVIRMDGKPVAQFPQSGVYQRFDTNGDNAIPFNLPELKCNIIMPYRATECKVSVSTVNHFMLESEQSETIFKLF